MNRLLTYAEAIREATEMCMSTDNSVYLMGLGVPDPKGIFGTTLGLQEKFGSNRVFDVPISENALTGVAIGSALLGKRPILTHQRLDFALLSVEQIVNQAAKWHYMFGGQVAVPIVIRMIVGRGWGQGPQHSQALHSWFAHIPGLKVVMPATAQDAKGLLIASVRDPNPVLYIEHRWLHGILGAVPKGDYTTEIGKAAVIREGKHVTIVAISYMVVEAIKAADFLHQHGIEAEVLDLRTVSPLDYTTIIDSLKKTQRLIVADIGHASFGVGSQIISWIYEHTDIPLLSRPKKVALPDYPTPTSSGLSKEYYPRAMHIAKAALEQVGFNEELNLEILEPEIYDIPDPNFKGPF